MIDVHTEDLISLPEAAKLPAFRVDRRQPRTSTLWRWVNLGARDHAGERVRLETIRTPSGRMTSLQAVGRFFAALNGVDVTELPPVLDPREPAARCREFRSRQPRTLPSSAA